MLFGHGQLCYIWQCWCSGGKAASEQSLLQVCWATKQPCPCITLHEIQITFMLFPVCWDSPLTSSPTVWWDLSPVQQEVWHECCRFPPSAHKTYGCHKNIITLSPPLQTGVQIVTLEGRHFNWAQNYFGHAFSCIGTPWAGGTGRWALLLRNGVHRPSTHRNPQQNASSFPITFQNHITRICGDAKSHKLS